MCDFKNALLYLYSIYTFTFFERLDLHRCTIDVMLN